MSLETFNHKLIANSQGYIEPNGKLPYDPQVTMSNETRIANALDQYMLDSIYSCFEAGILTTCLHYGVYSNGRGSNAIPVPQYKVDTVDPNFFASLKVLIPDLASRARLSSVSGNKDRLPQYVMKASGVKNQLMQLVDEKYRLGRNTFEELLASDISDRHFAFLAGILATGRGNLAIQQSSSEGIDRYNPRIQFYFREDSDLHRLLNILYPDRIFRETAQILKTKDGAGKSKELKFELLSEEAFELAGRLLSVCPPLGEIRPEILTLIFYATNDALTPAEYRRAYEEILGI